MEVEFAVGSFCWVVDNIFVVVVVVLVVVVVEVEGFEHFYSGKKDLDGSGDHDYKCWSMGYFACRFGSH